MTRFIFFPYDWEDRPQWVVVMAYVLSVASGVILWPAALAGSFALAHQMGEVGDWSWTAPSYLMVGVIGIAASTWLTVVVTRAISWAFRVEQPVLSILLACGVLYLLLFVLLAASYDGR